jgi:sigma-B regulation protein RsbU (phosphoserine phosphatase)
MLGGSPAQILTKTNEAICSNNEAEMFVTVWVGILELSTGKMTCANAGHEYPVFKRPDGKFELYKDKHGFVLGGLKEAKYKEYEILLEPGTKVFAYTDGVPEATNADKQLFGTDRMVEALNRYPDKAPIDILKGVRKAVDDFVQNAEQFDDITMLCLEYKGPQAPVKEE